MLVNMEYFRKYIIGKERTVKSLLMDQEGISDLAIFM